MNIKQLNHDVLRAYGISRRAGNGVLTKTYAKTIKTLEGHEQNEINCFVQLLTGCGFVNHARKLESLYKRMVDARKPIIKNDLTITAIAKFYSGRANGCSTLSLGERISNQGPDWRVTEPIRTVVVKGHNFKLGQRLPKLPKLAVPTDVFFGKNIRNGKDRQLLKNFEAERRVLLRSNGFAAEDIEMWIAPWYMEPVALEETMKIWGFTLEEFQHFMIEFYPCWAEIYGQVEYDSIWPGLKEETFRGDALRAMIQRIYKIRWKEEMPPGLGQGDPADQTYYWLDKRGFEVCIPSS